MSKAGEGREDECYISTGLEKKPYWDEKYNISTGLVAVTREREHVNYILSTHAKQHIGILPQQLNDDLVLSVSVAC